MSTNVTLGKRIKQLREKQKLTKTDFVNKHNFLTRVTLGYYENDKRRPDSDMIRELCKAFNVSADYLLCLSDTENPIFAKVAETTQLDETSITYLHNASPDFISLVNILLHEEPQHFDFGLPYVPYLSDKYDENEIAQKYNEQMEWEMERQISQETAILQHLSDDWSYEDFINTQSENELCVSDNSEDRIEGSINYGNSPPITYEDCVTQQAFFTDVWEHEHAEKMKSNLLSAIMEYVSYESGCRLETNSRSEDLSKEHSLHIGVSKNHKIQFPSKESDELFEFMLIQKVIEALKKFKDNYRNLNNA